MYVECTVMSPALSHRKRKKARKAQRLGVNVEVLFRRDIERLASRWRLDGLERTARTHRSSRPDRRHEGRDRLG
jgi:hypothetical protein